ncbi:MAG TPA: hypothetical protein VI363_00510 [Burkholderiales bacterium]
MIDVDPVARADAAASSLAGAARLAFGYEPAEGGEQDRIRIPMGGNHRVGGLNDIQKARLIGAFLELQPERGERLVLLGVEVDGLGAAERAALRARVALLPAAGGLISSLNAWENIVLPLGFHDPKRLPGIAEQVHDLLGRLGAHPGNLLAKLPERMSRFEMKLTGYVRILLENPELVLIEDLFGGLGAGERVDAAGFPEAYQTRCPGGTMVQLESGPVPSTSEGERHAS